MLSIAGEPRAEDGDDAWRRVSRRGHVESMALAWIWMELEQLVLRAEQALQRESLLGEKMSASFTEGTRRRR